MLIDCDVILSGLFGYAIVGVIWDSIFGSYGAFRISFVKAASWIGHLFGAY